MPSTVQEDIVEFGIYTNWDGNFVYNFEMNNPSGLDFEADLILANTPGPGVPPYYKIKMDWREISPDTILVSPLP